MLHPNRYNSAKVMAFAALAVIQLLERVTVFTLLPGQDEVAREESHKPLTKTTAAQNKNKNIDKISVKFG